MVEVSVVIPTVGREELGRALGSVRAQTMPCDDVIVVLDRPSEAAKVRSMLGSERLIVTDGAVGGGEARNLGLRSARGRWVAFLDDDDWWEPEKVELQLDRMKRESATLGYAASAFHGGRELRVLPTQPYEEPDSLASYLVRRPGIRHGAGYMQTSSLIVCSQLARAVEWDSSLRKHQDWDFVVRLAAHEDCRISYSPEPLVNVVQNSVGSISKRPDWRASEIWFRRHKEGLDRRAAGDFVATQIMRSSFGAMDLDGMRAGLKLLRGTRPHLAATAVSGFGLAEWAGRRFKELAKR
ncbi:glycosyltransferase family 2 protein [Prescottella equi]|uniref:Glycosyltransferase n=1 Tax=Rhodococcus hoagii TaxID=43767 RepID=A0A9Q4ZM19_RHOHA|nr:glycosyltransferase family A protein [Prescottella equi]MBM4491329.1 glycosyltransferase [Prescottella equi]MBM4502276.1 glycosyltransferase [Prescottella equi]MBM4504468.1 glycosyltransferase [Prescottella equi]MBM4506116.1 glycosyltransferase [Prescottella equi]MBM4506123.1 glycosyltransferase [Prescottella equi]